MFPEHLDRARLGILYVASVHPEFGSEEMDGLLKAVDASYDKATGGEDSPVDEYEYLNTLWDYEDKIWEQSREVRLNVLFHRLEAVGEQEKGTAKAWAAPEVVKAHCARMDEELRAAQRAAVSSIRAWLCGGPLKRAHEAEMRDEGLPSR